MNDRHHRRRLPTTRQALNHKFRIGDHEGYLTVGLFEDGSPGELFIHMNKAGSTVSGLADGIAVLTSLALQSGVPLETIAAKFEGQKFEPSGYTGSDVVPYADSITDYIFRWLTANFSAARRKEGTGLLLPTLDGAGIAPTTGASAELKGTK